MTNIKKKYTVLPSTIGLKITIILSTAQYNQYKKQKVLSATQYDQYTNTKNSQFRPV